METSTPITLEKKKFPFLKKGTAVTRLNMRSLSIHNQRPEMSHRPESKSSNHSLPIIANLSPIPHQPPITTNRPRTAETNDSGVRDLQTDRSPSNHSSLCSIVTVQTNFHRNTTTSSSKEPEVDEAFVQRLNDIAPGCVKQAEEKINRAHTASPSNSYTSLDRIATPPIVNDNEIEQSDFSATVHLDAAPKSLDEYSVGTSKQQQMASSSIDNRNDRNHECTPLNRHTRLMKSYSFDDRSIIQPSFIGEQLKKEGIHLSYKYKLPPRPIRLPTPEIKNKSVTNGNLATIPLFQTPILRQSEKVDGRLESLAGQLRAVILTFDAGKDVMHASLAQYRFVVEAKKKDYERRENEIKERAAVEEKKLIRENAKLKLEADKMKEQSDLVKKYEAEIKELKTKYIEASRNLSDTRSSRDKIKQKYEESEAGKQAEKEKNQKLRETNSKLSTQITNLRQAPTIQQPLQEQPVKPLQQRQNRPTIVQPFITPVTSNQLKHSSTSSSGSSAKGAHVHWSSPIAETHSDPFENNENISSLQMWIPDDMRPADTLNNPDSIEKIYSNFGRFRKMKICNCESIKYDNGDYQYLCIDNVNVSIMYWSENGQLTVQLPGGYHINSFPSKQLEIHRPNNEKSIVGSTGRRYEYLNVAGYQNQAIETFDDNEWKRVHPDGSTEPILKDDAKTTIRAENDFVEQKDLIVFTCPPFSVTRLLDNNGEDFMGTYNIKVNGNDPNKYWQLNVCPAHRAFVIKHCTRTSGRSNKVLCFVEGRCEHVSTLPTK